MKAKLTFPLNTLFCAHRSENNPADWESELLWLAHAVASLLLPHYLWQFHLLSTAWERKGLVVTSLEKVKVKVSQSCLTLCDPMDCTVHGILQARILEWRAFPFSRGSSQLRDRTQVSCVAGGFFTS